MNRQKFNLENLQATVVFTAAYQFMLVSKCIDVESADLSSVKIYITGGSKVATDAIAQMNQFLSNGQVVVVYGVTEAGFISVNYTKLTNSYDSCGSLLNGMELKIVDEDGRKLGIGEDGEICIKNAIKPMGYYNNPKLTQELFDSEDFVLTGDVGHFDENGNLHLSDRSKDVFKCRLTHIFPGEIENVLMSHDAISGACVVGIPDPEVIAPNLTAAVVTKRKGYDVTEKQIHGFVAGSNFFRQFLRQFKFKLFFF